MGRIRSSGKVEPMADAAYAIDPATEGLLQNWGRWARVNKGGAGGSSNALWRFASRGTRASAPADALDTEQARLLERIVCSPGFSPKMRALLVAHYVTNAHPHRTCTAVGVLPVAYAEWVWRATAYLAQRYRDRAAKP